MLATHIGGSGAGPIVPDQVGALAERRPDHSRPSSRPRRTCKSRSPSTRSAGAVHPDPADAGAVSFSPVPVPGVIREVAASPRAIISGWNETMLRVDRFVSSEQKCHPLTSGTAGVQSLTADAPRPGLFRVPTRV